MANTIDDASFFLQDNWPGSAPYNAETPIDGFAEAADQHHAQSEEVFPLGIKFQVYNDGSAGPKGYSTFIYLKVGTQDATAIAAKSFVVPESATNLFQVSNDPSQALYLPTGLVAVALSAIANGEYGWFWCGGVCPVQYVSALNGNYVQDDTIVAGGPITAITGDVVQLGLSNDNDGGSIFQGCAGYALAAT